jgi:hypothetical protein
LAAGNLDATIILERMWDEIAQDYAVDVLCGYFRSAFANEKSISTLERVCAEHTTAHGRELCYEFKLLLVLGRAWAPAAPEHEWLRDECRIGQARSGEIEFALEKLRLSACLIRSVPG